MRGEGVPPLTFRSWRRAVALQALPNRWSSSVINVFLCSDFSIFWKSIFTANCNRKIVATFANCNFSRRFSLASSMYTSVGRLVFFLNEKNQFAKITILTLIATQKCEQRNQWIPRWVASACFGSHLAKNHCTFANSLRHMKNVDGKIHCYPRGSSQWFWPPWASMTLLKIVTAPADQFCCTKFKEANQCTLSYIFATTSTTSTLCELRCLV